MKRILVILLVLLLGVSAFCYTKSEVDLLARLVQTEAGNQSIKGKKAVAQVVLNRLKSKQFGKSIRSVIYARHQFAKPKRYASKETRAIVQAVMDGDQVLPNFIGAKTKAAVLAFQKTNKLSQTGTINDATRKALFA